jgi:uncharacterized protein
VLAANIKFMNKYNWIIQFRWHILAIFSFITLAFLPFAIQVKPNNSIETMGVINDPALTLLKQLEKQFGSEEFVSISFSHENIFNPKILKIIKSISSQIEKLSSIDSVLSLTNAKDLISKDSQNIAIQKIIKPKWFTAGVPKESQNKILQNKNFQKILFNNEGTATSIIAQFKSLGSDNFERDQVIKQIETIVKSYENSNLRIHLIGMSIFDRFAMQIVEKEQYITSGVIVLIAALILFAMYRKSIFVILPLAIMGIVMVWLMGIIWLTDSHFSWILATAPGIVLIVSICDSVHFINLHLKMEQKNIALVIKELIIPCGLTSFTTAIGFFSLATSNLIPLRDFGIFAGIGSLFTFVATILLLPIGLSFVKTQNQSLSVFRNFQKTLTKIHNINLNHPKKIISISLVILVFFALGIPQINIEANNISMFKWGDQSFKEAHAYTLQNVGLGSEFYAFLEGGPQDFTEPEVLKSIEKFQNKLAAISQLTIKSVSLADLVKQANQVMHNNNPEYYKIPESKQEISQLLLLYSMQGEDEILNKLVIDDYAKTRIRIFTYLSNSAKQTLKEIQDAEVLAQEIFPHNIKFGLSGRPAIMTNSFFFIAHSQIKGLAIALLAICLILALLFRSIKESLFSIIPNTIPIVILMGMMGWFKINLNMGTALAACLSLGLVVDDTIHLMWNVKKHIHQGHDYKESLKLTLNKVGPAMIITTMIMCCGFLGLLISQLWPTTFLGILVATACLSALICDLYLTPVLINYLKPFGKSNQKTITASNNNRVSPSKKIRRA